MMPGVIAMKCRCDRGQAIVEFCVILPLLLILLVGTIEFCIVMYDEAVITNASREGARAGIVSQIPPVPVSQIQSVVSNYCTNHLISFGTNTPVTTVKGYTLWAAPSIPLTVTVSYTYSFLVLPNFLKSGRQLTLTAKTTMYYEGIS
jgi:Flp pilus assembly protein TadG